MATTDEKIKVTEWDPAEMIRDKEDVLVFLQGAIEENDPELLLETIGDIARSKGMAQLAQELGIDRSGLYKSFSAGGNPSFLTVAKVLDNLGFGISIYKRVS